MNNRRGWIKTALIFTLSSLLFAVECFAIEEANTSANKVDNNQQQMVEEGWIEKKISPSTQWVESIFAPFTQWMEDEIQEQYQDTDETSTPSIYEKTLIPAKQATAVILEYHPGKILRAQFLTGPPPFYKIKLLSNSGKITHHYINAFTALPFIPADITEEPTEGQQ